jgi:hypothetical protein
LVIQRTRATQATPPSRELTRIILPPPELGTTGRRDNPMALLVRDRRSHHNHRRDERAGLHASLPSFRISPILTDSATAEHNDRQRVASARVVAAAPAARPANSVSPAVWVTGSSTPRLLVLDDEIPVALRGCWRRKNPVGGWCYFTTTTRTTRSHDDRPSAWGGAVRVRVPRRFRPRDVPARLSARRRAAVACAPPVRARSRGQPGSDFLALKAANAKANAVQCATHAAG